MLMRVVTGFTGPWTRTNGVSWLKLLVFILILRWAFFELYSIPSGSMEPVLHGDERFLKGDRVAVNKALFGPRIPFTTIRIFPLGKPNRWDIVVFNNVEPNAEHATLIKRVVGLPGEHVRILNGQIYVNKEPIEPPEELRDILYYTRTVIPPRPMVRDFMIGISSRLLGTEAVDSEVYGADRVADDLSMIHDRLDGLDLATLSELEKDGLVAGVRPLTYQYIGELLANQMNIKSNFHYAVDSGSKFTEIPEGHYLMLGDNSGNSGDGRAFGWVPHENMYGRAFAIAWPFARSKDLTGFTATLWGKLLLYGIPLLFVGYEFTRSFVMLSWRVAKEGADGEFHPGERVRINRLAYGFRAPFTKKLYVFARTPAMGDVVAYLHREAESKHVALRFGRVTSASLEKCIVGPASSSTTVARGNIVGRAASVWWPMDRRRTLADRPPVSQS